MNERSRAERSANAARRRISIDFEGHADTRHCAAFADSQLPDEFEDVPFDEDGPTTTWDGSAKIGPDDDTPLETWGEAWLSDGEGESFDLKEERAGVTYCLSQPSRPLSAHPERPGYDPVHMAAFFAAFAPPDQPNAGESSQGPAPARSSYSALAVSAVPKAWKHPSARKWPSPSLFVAALAACGTVLVGLGVLYLPPTPVGLPLGTVRPAESLYAMLPTAVTVESPTDSTPPLTNKSKTATPSVTQSPFTQPIPLGNTAAPARNLTEREPSNLSSPRATIPQAQLPPLLPPEVDVQPFNRGSALTALNAAASAASTCRAPNTPNSPVSVHVTFASSGVVTIATVDGVYAGTPVGGCIARTFRSARISPFSGQAVSVHKTFQLP